MPKRLLACAGIAASIAFAATVWFADPFLLFVFSVIPMLWIGLPVSLVALVILVISARRGRSIHGPLKTLAVVAALALLVGLAFAANHFVQKHAVAAAKNYPAALAPQLETYLRTTGSYPASLDHIPRRPYVPRLLRSSHAYHSDGTRYFFRFAKPGGLIDSWEYDSETRTWQLSD